MSLKPSIRAPLASAMQSIQLCSGLGSTFKAHFFMLSELMPGGELGREHWGEARWGEWWLVSDRGVLPESVHNTLISLSVSLLQLQTLYHFAGTHSPSDAVSARGCKSPALIKTCLQQHSRSPVWPLAPLFPTSHNKSIPDTSSHLSIIHSYSGY